jgi:O-methyltransferase
LLPDDPVTLVTGSLASPGWTGGLDPGRDTLVIAEGVLMYLDSDGLAACLVGDYVHPKIAASDRHPIVKATGAKFLSGVRNGQALADTVPGYRLVAEHLVMERIGFAQRTAARAFTALTRGGRMYAIAHLRESSRA